MLSRCREAPGGYHRIVHALDAAPEVVVAPRPRPWSRRHPGDGIRAALAAAVLTAAIFVARSGDVGAVQRWLFRLVNGLPAGAGAWFVGVMQLGSLGALPFLVLVCVLSRRVRLGVLVAIGGFATWVAAKILQAVVAEPRPHVHVAHSLLHGAAAPGFSFPSTHVALAAALATVAAPYFGRSGRRFAWLLVLAIAVARVYVGAHLPVDAVGGAALGWLVGSLLHVALGAPRGVPTPAFVADQLERLGLEPAVLEPMPYGRDGAPTYRATSAHGGRSFVKIVGRDQREVDWLYRSWRIVVFRELGDAPALVSPQHRVEHEALMLTLAHAAGVAVPRVLTASPLDEGEAVLARSWVDGRSLSGLPTVSPVTLRRCWETVAALHRADLAHGALDTDAIVVEPSGRPVLVGFAGASAHATREQLARDVAELCTSTALLVGPERAVRAAVDVLGCEAVAAALPTFQPLALTTSTRRALRTRAHVLDDVRARIARLSGRSVSPAQRPLRVAVRNVVPLLAVGFAVYALLGQVGDAHRTLDAASHADVVWLFAALGIYALSFLAAGLALQGATSRPIAWRRTSLVQLAVAFTNQLAPSGLGGLATNIRYLEGEGASRPAALTAVGLNTVAGFLVHVAFVAAIVPIVGIAGGLHAPRPPHLPHYWTIPFAVLVVLVGAGAWFWRHRLHRLLAMARESWDAIVDVGRRPRRALALFGGSAGVTTAQALALVLSLHAFGDTLPVLDIVAVFLVGSVVAAAAPTPGGLGALEAALVAGLTQLGAPVGPSVAGVLASRLITFWLPIVPGAFAFHALRRRAVL